MLVFNFNFFFMVSFLFQFPRLYHCLVRKSFNSISKVAALSMIKLDSRVCLKKKNSVCGGDVSVAC